MRKKRIEGSGESHDRRGGGEPPLPPDALGTGDVIGFDTGGTPAKLATDAVAVGLIDTQTAVVLAGNAAYGQLLEQAPESIVGLPVEAFLDGERAAVSRTVLKAMRDGWVDSLEGETEVRRPTGPISVYSWSLALGEHPPRDAVVAGAVPMVGGVETKLDAPPVDLDRIILGTVDREWCFHDLAVTSASLLGWPSDRAGWGRLHEIVHPGDEDALDHAFDPQVVDQRPTTVGVRLRSGDENWLDARVTVSRLYGRPTVPFAVVIALAAGPGPSGAAADRIDRLEFYLARIDAELRAARVMTPASTARFEQLSELTKRETEIVRRLLEGQRVPAIARDLFLSPSTVRNHLSAVFARFAVHSQSDLLNLLREGDIASD